MHPSAPADGWTVGVHRVDSVAREMDGEMRGPGGRNAVPRGDALALAVHLMPWMVTLRLGAEMSRAWARGARAGCHEFS